MSHPALAEGPIYLDYNATTPVDPAVLQAALPYLATHFGNPSSAHAYAHAPREALARARVQLADLLGARPEEIVFTGGGSESDTLAIRGAALARADDGRRQILTLATEHPAVLQACRSLERDGYLTGLLPVDACGRLDPAVLREALDRDTALVSIAYGNSETGTLQPLPELAALARAAGALFHTDAAQAAGKVPIDVAALGVDLLTVVGHKMYAPKGVGALYVRSGVALDPVIAGGGQEDGRRAGTENVAFVAALGAAADLAGRELPDSLARLAGLRDLLQAELERLLPGRVRLNGHPAMRLPGTLNVGIDGIDGRALLAAVPEVAAATGSACHEGTDVVSPVLTAMGLPEQRARSALRLSLGRWSTEAEVRRAAALLARAADAFPRSG
ncbi:cysteine desulfurase [Planomonospora parontospora subsp. parontospora]|uniref:Cysteine desulfurase n=2 Tax=Planomonospora parontospora TaxID=58119 RepID=A0AA37BIS0_9ACTN|nr:cysteine desulfurase family protein [Planomonospora parontospora]GGK76790.1 cysteine desulfurase [Planomonospora parontospora]GII10087.1 cysteine desulfurase [Planomonospora parontospora subsp. parontospora]